MGAALVLDPPSILGKVGDREFRFYASSGAVLFKLRPVAKVIGRAVAAFTYRPEEETGYTRREWKGEAEGVEVTVPATDAKLAEQRYAQHREAVEALIDAFLDEKNAPLVALLIHDSMRDEFGSRKKSFSTAEAEEFLGAYDVGTIVLLLTHVLNANKQSLGPLWARPAEALAPATERPETEASEK